jgi:5-methyltetrahydrofolate--homocysteine methyltransferase
VLAHDTLALDERGAAYLEAAAHRVVIFDGAMGTTLQLAGLSAEDFGGHELEGCNEALVLSRPDAVAAVHRAFLEVGRGRHRDRRLRSLRSCWPSTDSGPGRTRSTWPRPARPPAADEYVHARAAPLGGREPGPRHQVPTLGQIPYADLRDAYEEQASALLAGGVDLLIIETVFDLLAAKAAMNACPGPWSRRDGASRSRSRSPSS